MTVEEYREKIIKTFHKTGCEELITFIIRPEEEEFQMLEDILNLHYKKQKSNTAPIVN